MIYLHVKPRALRSVICYITYSSRHQIACFKVTAKSCSVATNSEAQPSEHSLERSGYQIWQRCTVDTRRHGGDVLGLGACNLVMGSIILRCNRKYSFLAVSILLFYTLLKMATFVCCSKIYSSTKSQSLSEILFMSQKLVCSRYLL